MLPPKRRVVVDDRPYREPTPDCPHIAEWTNLRARRVLEGLKVQFSLHCLLWRALIRDSPSAENCAVQVGLIVLEPNATARLRGIRMNIREGEPIAPSIRSTLSLKRSGKLQLACPPGAHRPRLQQLCGQRLVGMPPATFSLARGRLPRSCRGDRLPQSCHRACVEYCGRRRDAWARVTGAEQEQRRKWLPDSGRTCPRGPAGGDGCRERQRPRAPHRPRISWHDNMPLVLPMVLRHDVQIPRKHHHWAQAHQSMR